MYQMFPMNEERKIVVRHEKAELTIDPFLELLRSIQLEMHGELLPRPQNGFCYELRAAEMKLLFKWSSKTGIRVIVPPETDALGATRLIAYHCTRLNQPIPEQPARALVRRKVTRKQRNSKDLASELKEEGSHEANNSEKAARTEQTAQPHRIHGTSHARRMGMDGGIRDRNRSGGRL